MKKFKVATLGCRTNQYESQAFRDQLLGMGYAEAKGEEKADLCIVNTCTVTASADSASRHQIRELVRENGDAKVVVTGCLAERRPDLIASIEGVSAVVSNLEKEDLISKLFPEDTVPEFSIKNFEDHTRAFVKVQDGCNSFCTYCIIPYVRGRSRSKTIPEVLREVQDLVENGYKEVVITGINVGDFEGGNGERLAELIRAVDAVEGIERLRLSSIDPDEVDEALTAAIMNGKHTCHSMHIVLQAGSNRILKRMNRKYTRQVFLETVDKLKSIDPDFTFTTDVIVGFPGETEEDFNETLAIMEQVKFAKVHMFPYSRRERTKAAQYLGQVPDSVIKERKKRVLEASERQTFELQEGFVGRKMTVLTENNNTGHTANFLTVLLQTECAPNQLVNVELIENTPAGLKGAVL